MIEASQLIAGLASILLLGVLAAWARLLLGSPLQWQDGPTRTSSRQVEKVSRVLFGAVALGAVAALLAIIGWFSS